MTRYVGQGPTEQTASPSASVEIPDEVVQIADRAYWDKFGTQEVLAVEDGDAESLISMRAALDAALPYLVPAASNHTNCTCDDCTACPCSWAQITVGHLCELGAAAPSGDGGLRDASAEPKLSNPSPDGLREALEKLLARKVEQSNGVDTEWSTVTVRQLRELLAAPAVPQPVDREALADDFDSLLWQHRAVASNGTQTVCACDRAWRSDTEHRTHLRNAVLAVLAGGDS